MAKNEELDARISRAANYTSKVPRSEIVVEVHEDEATYPDLSGVTFFFQNAENGFQYAIGSKDIVSTTQQFELMRIEDLNIQKIIEAARLVRA